MKLSPFLFLQSLLIAGLVLLFAFSMQALFEGFAVEKRLRAAEAELKDIRSRNRELETRLALATNRDRAEAEIARWGYVRTNEKLVEMVIPPAPEAAGEKPISLWPWILALSLGAGGAFLWFRREKGRDGRGTSRNDE